MITAVRNEKYVARNASLFKPVQVDSLADEEGEECEDEDLSDLNSS